MTDTVHRPQPRIRTPRVRTLLDHLFARADHDGETDTDWQAFLAASAAERADLCAAEYMPVSRTGGELLYSLVRATSPLTVLEFGTSYGISTIYLAAAVADNQKGHVHSSELSTAKLAAAGANLAEAGLDDVVTLLPGDARETLPRVEGPIDLLLLDGWKDLYLPVLRALEPALRPGAMVIADDSTFDSVGEYLHYVRDPQNGYVSTAFPVEDGMEISTRA
ncbi:O-methyltransferase [Cryptosporangium sp. NPDC048952]|uniref:O-methyltransferase n=1 Tax=Cryptosporangium sp. NPDC048952 TaxID=3363961 RepID=UPI0037136259